MKINKYILGSIMALGLAVSGLAYADMNKYIQYREVVEATKGTTAPESDAWTHVSKYSRENAERAGIGGTFLPSEPREWAPKNYRNIY